MFKEHYTKMNEDISPSSALIFQTIQKTKTPKPSPSHTFRLRPIALIASILVCLLICTPVVAAYVPSIYELMYAVSPEIAQRFTPIQMTCEDNGIQMEVVSVSVQGNTAEVYITMQDLTDDRIDETTDLFDSYHISQIGDCSATCQKVDYSAEEKKATFLISICSDKEPITDNRITFSVKKFLSRKVELLDVPVAFDLQDAPPTPETQIVGPGRAHMYGISGVGVENFDLNDTFLTLLPGEESLPLAEDIYLTNAGYVDGKLHLQMLCTNRKINDAHGYFYLADQNGNILESDHCLHFSMDKNDTSSGYSEFVFDLSPEEAENYDIYGCFYTSGMLTTGNWRVSFSLDAE